MLKHIILQKLWKMYHVKENIHQLLITECCLWLLLWIKFSVYFRVAGLWIFGIATIGSFWKFCLFLCKTYAQHNAFPGQQDAKYIFNINKLKGGAFGDGSAVHLPSTSDSADESSDVFGGDLTGKSEFY